MVGILRAWDGQLLATFTIQRVSIREHLINLNILTIAYCTCEAIIYCLGAGAKCETKPKTSDLPSCRPASIIRAETFTSTGACLTSTQLLTL